MGHSGHVFHVVHRMRGRFGRVAEWGESGVIRGDEIADNDSHGALAEKFARGIVVGGGDFEFIARGEFFSSSGEESFDGHAQEMALVVGLRGERSESLFLRGVFQNDLPSVIVHVAADTEEDAVVFDGNGAGLFTLAGGKVIAGIAAG